MINKNSTLSSCIWTLSESVIVLHVQSFKTEQQILNLQFFLWPQLFFFYQFMHKHQKKWQILFLVTKRSQIWMSISDSDPPPPLRMVSFVTFRKKAGSDCSRHLLLSFEFWRPFESVFRGPIYTKSYSTYIHIYFNIHFVNRGFDIISRHWNIQPSASSSTTGSTGCTLGR